MSKYFSHEHREDKWTKKWADRYFVIDTENIPLPARLMALCDVYDALSCSRVYKKAMPHHKVVSMIIDGRGKHFDPEIVDAFLSIHLQFASIADVLRDPDDTQSTTQHIYGQAALIDGLCFEI